MGFHVCIGDGSVAGASLVLGCIKPVVESPGFCRSLTVSAGWRKSGSLLSGHYGVLL